MDEVEFYLNQFESEDFPTRRVAALKLGDLGDKRSVKPLIRFLGDQSWQVRNTIIEALIRIRDKNSISPLLECLRDEDPAIRNSAMSVLIEMGEDVIKPLMELLLKDTSEKVRIFSANTLGHLNSEESVAALVTALKDRDENVRHAAVEALGSLGSPEAVMPLTEAMGKENRWSRFTYISALGKIGDERACPVCIASLDDEVLCYPAVIALGNIGDICGLDPILEMTERSSDPTILKACAISLAEITSEAELFGKTERQGYFHKAFAEKLMKVESQGLVNILLEMLNSETTREWNSSFSLLRYVKGDFLLRSTFSLFTDDSKESELRDLVIRRGMAALDEAKKALDLPEVEIQSNLIRVIGVLGSADDDETIIPFLDSPTPEVVCDALKSLGMINATGQFDRMAGFLASEDYDIRNSAVGGTAMLAAEGIKTKIVELLGSKNEYVRRGGYRILGFYSDPDVLEVLIGGFSDESPVVRSAAVQSLGYAGVANLPLLQGRKNLEALSRMLFDEDIEVRVETILAVGRINKDETNAMLVEILDSDVNKLRRYAIRSIGNSGFSEAVPKLCELLESEHTIENRIFICITLGQCKNPYALPALKNALRDAEPEITAEAINAIGQIGDRSAVSEILPYLDSLDWIVRNAVLGALHDLEVNSALPAVLGFMEGIRTDQKEGILLRKAILLVGKIGGPEQAKDIISFLADPRCAYEAFNALMLIWKRHGFSYNLESIPDSKSRRLACSVLGHTKNTSAIEALSKCLKDEYPSVRRAAALAMGAIGNTETVKALKDAEKVSKDRWLRKIISHVLSLMGEK